MATETFIELSHVVANDLETYPGLPAPKVGTFLSRDDAEAHYAPGTRFLITSIEMVANTGTYIDAPFHRFEDGVDLAGLSLESMANVPGIRVSLSGRSIGPDAFRSLDVAGKAVLVSTGWSKHWGHKAYLDDYPFLSRACGAYLAEAGARLVGIDSPNVDDNTDGERPVHTTLLGAGIPIVEHLTGLARLPERDFRFFAVPPPVRGLTSFPVRAFAIVTDLP